MIDHEEGRNSILNFDQIQSELNEVESQYFSQTQRNQISSPKFGMLKDNPFDDGEDRDKEIDAFQVTSELQIDSTISHFKYDE